MVDSTKDNVLGALFGQAVGDALGMGAEFLKKVDIASRYPNGLRHYSDISYSIIPGYHPGDYTDDTEMMVSIVDSLNKKGHYDLMDIAKSFLCWIESVPAGMGSLTASVLRNPLYKTDPLGASRTVWEKLNKTPSSNGGIMRTSVIGVLKGDVEKMAADVCRLTHYDPRCVGSSVIVSLAIHNLIYHDYTMSVDEVVQIGKKYDEKIERFVRLAANPNIENLQLDKRGRYTLKTLSAALWALWHPTSFVDGLIAIVNEGGDADTNGAPSGAILGARFGYNAIPTEYTEGLNRYKELKMEFEKLMLLIH